MMNAINISKLRLSPLSLKFHNLLFQTFWSKNRFLLCCGSYFEPQTAKKCHFSQITSRSRAVMITDEPRQLQSIVLKYSEYLHLFALCPPSFTHSRNYSNGHLRNTGKQSQDKMASKWAEVGTNEAVDDEEVGSKSEPGKKLTLYQRFKKTYKEHGKVLVGVHLLTSAVWFGTFYTVARCGVDVVPLMESLNFSERIISPFRSGSLGDVAVAYLMYKLATPARYTVTIGGTNLAIRYLRKGGKMPHVPHEDTIRSLYKEGKERFKRRSHVHFRHLQRKHRIRPRVMHARERH